MDHGGLYWEKIRPFLTGSVEELALYLNVGTLLVFGDSDSSYYSYTLVFTLLTVVPILDPSKVFEVAYMSLFFLAFHSHIRAPSSSFVFGLDPVPLFCHMTPSSGSVLRFYLLDPSSGFIFRFCLMPFLVIDCRYPSPLGM